MSIKLTAKERKSIEWLRDFSTRLLDGEPLEYQKAVVDQLKRMGIDVGFVSHKDVNLLVRGKESPYVWRITSGEWYIRGKASKRYLPFQIKELKDGS